ncbi:hypothetical protein KDAU_07500 [Dictyobacter aurantiacus]|uniref:HMA domain-containing protein n=1 Tax=Dictyobacter aurantiacus TaxID=1936993 RepID=A0A401Z974_9CHLR|nr:hypothetical protein KDAU_07500 [Dictyobacter aurantiacus]
MKTQHITIPIEDLRCGGSLQVERALAHLPGIIYAYVNPTIEMAYIEYDPNQVNQEQCTHTIEQAGFRAGPPCLR